jgi:YesN/AraC family two-component response regulator
MENLFRLEKDFKIIARCLDGQETIKAVCKHEPNILILDIRMPHTDGLAVLQAIKKKNLPTRVVLLRRGALAREAVGHCGVRKDGPA